jgi:hypothetical protein
LPSKNGTNPYRPRRCKYCKLMFVPTCKDSHNADIAKFCSRKHKDAYRRNGGMNMERLEEVVIRATIKALKEDETFLEALLDKLRVIQVVGVRRAIQSSRFADNPAPAERRETTFAPGDH